MQPEYLRFKFCGFRKSSVSEVTYLMKAALKHCCWLKQTRLKALTNFKQQILFEHSSTRVHSPSQDGEINDFTHHLISLSSWYIGTVMSSPCRVLITSLINDASLDQSWLAKGQGNENALVWNNIQDMCFASLFQLFGVCVLFAEQSFTWALWLF